MSTPATPGAMQPDDRFRNTGQGDRTYRYAGLAIVGIGIVVTMKDPWVRDVLRSGCP